jgi:hypothetical protein
MREPPSDESRVVVAMLYRQRDIDEILPQRIARHKKKGHQVEVPRF